MIGSLITPSIDVHKLQCLIASPRFCTWVGSDVSPGFLSACRRNGIAGTESGVCERPYDPDGSQNPA